MDLRLAIEETTPGADYNPAAFDFSENEARAKKLWRDPRPMPTQKELEDAWKLIEKDFKDEEAKNKRRGEFPPIGDQLDAIWKQFEAMKSGGQNLTQDANSILNKIKEVKENNPKG